MKTDYTITPEYDAAQYYLACESWFASEPEANPFWKSQAQSWAKVYEDARASHAAGEPLIRTVCKIATRILLVLLIVGIAVGVMTA